MPAAATRVCPQCGATVPRDAQFCTSCNLSLVEADKAALELREMRERRRRAYKVRILIAIFIVIILLGYFFLT